MTSRPWAPLDLAGNVDLKESIALEVFDGVGRQTLPTDLSDVFYSPASGFASYMSSPVMTLSLPLVGLLSAYPDDSYEASGDFLLHLPASVRLSMGPFPPESVLTVRLMGITVDPNAGDYAVTYYRPSAAQTIIKIDRSLSYRVFVYAICFLPLALSIVLAHLMIRRAMNISMVLSLVFGALFTILPLRLVLVPLDIGGLTHVDLLLASELMLLLIVGVTSYFVEIWAPASATVEESPVE